MRHLAGADYCRSIDRPVDDAVLVQEHEGENDLGRVELAPLLREPPRLLDLEHEVASAHVLHHEEQAVLRRRRARKNTISVVSVTRIPERKRTSLFARRREMERPVVKLSLPMPCQLESSFLILQTGIHLHGLSITRQSE